MEPTRTVKCMSEKITCKHSTERAQKTVSSENARRIKSRPEQQQQVITNYVVTSSLSHSNFIRCYCVCLVLCAFIAVVQLEDSCAFTLFNLFCLLRFFSRIVLMWLPLILSTSLEIHFNLRSPPYAHTACSCLRNNLHVVRFHSLFTRWIDWNVVGASLYERERERVKCSYFYRIC